jgi:hypothetical protein
MIDEVATISEETSNAADNVTDTTEQQLESLKTVEHEAAELGAQAEKLRAVLDQFEVSTTAHSDSTSVDTQITVDQSSTAGSMAATDGGKQPDNSGFEFGDNK